MKYMGSKRAMLQNGLGDLLAKEIASATRFVDLFAGSGAVSSHVAQKSKISVLACDLQSYSTVVASAVLGRNQKLAWRQVWSAWHRRAKMEAQRHKFRTGKKLTQLVVSRARAWCERKDDLLVTRAYGGHYFSPKQAVWIDALLATLPTRNPARTVARAALIQAASRCAAAPGHTAQPFQPTKTAKKFLSEAWQRDVVRATRGALRDLANVHAQKEGKVIVDDANNAAKKLRKGDLVFLDPPYSGVHYSRFYHVLETIARGKIGEVSGTGRYPHEDERPRSSYSVSSEAPAALDDLLKTVASRGARAILTFPDHVCSNGLSGSSVRQIARRHFRIRTEHVKSLFSSMGGTGDKKRKGEAKRNARHITKELMLVLEQKPARC
jgi:adenine-specific DNA methylase